MDPKDYIDDDIYKSLKASFLHSGRGRPKGLRADIVINNKLLVQLSYLREEGEKSYDVIDKWLKQLKPEMNDFCGASTHLQNLVHSVKEKFLTLWPSNHVCYLQELVDVNFISDALSKFGVTKVSFHAPPSVQSDPVHSLTHQFVIDIEHYRKNHGFARKVSMEWLHHLGGFDMSRLQYAVDSVLKTYVSLNRNKHRDPDAVASYAKRNFQLCQRRVDSHQPEPIVTSPSPCPSNNLISQMDKQSKKVLELEGQLSVSHSDRTNLMDIINSLQGEKKVLEGKLSVALSESEQKEQEILSMQEKVERQHLKFQTKLNDCQKNSDFLQTQLDSTLETCSNLKDKLSDRKKNMKQLKGEVLDLKNEIVRLGGLLCEKSGWDDLSLKTGTGFNAYTDDVRKAVIALQCEAGVSAANVSKVINIVASNIFHHVFTDNLPCPKTAVNMCDEGYYVSQVQATESILECDNVTLHSDGTSRDGKKIVSNQISTSNGETLYLGFIPVATEDANTLLDITLKCIDMLSDSYSNLVDVPQSELFSEILRRISSTMSDRAAPMKLFGRKLQDHIRDLLNCDVTLNFLHCSAHFILGLSSSCDKALSAAEKKLVQGGGALGRDKEVRFGNFSCSETAASRLIRTTCDCLGPRGDQKSGCRVEWLTYCNDSIIPSFKANRFNCYFEAAASIIYHRSKIMSFFSSGILNDNLNLKLQSVSIDMQDDRLLCLICALALFYLKVSGPYWKLINSDVKYADFYIYVQQMFTAFELFSENPSQLLDRSLQSVFNNCMCIVSPTWEAVHAFAEKAENVSLIEETIQVLVKDCIEVTQRQLADFLSGGKFENVPESVREAIHHCPLTNLIGEGAFGDFDFDTSKRRNASLHNRSTVHVVKRNRTMHYLSKKSPAMQKKILQVARKKGPVIRKINKDLEEKVKVDIKKKFVENQEKKIEKRINEISKHSDILDKVKKHGGPCRSVEELDILIINLKDDRKSDRQISEIVKCEIRYQKMIRGAKIKFGDLDNMISSLKKCLEPPDQ